MCLFFCFQNLPMDTTAMVPLAGYLSFCVKGPFSSSRLTFIIHTFQTPYFLSFTSASTTSPSSLS